MYKNIPSVPQPDLQLQDTKERKNEEVDTILHTKNSDIETLAAPFQEMVSSVSL